MNPTNYWSGSWPDDLPWDLDERRTAERQDDGSHPLSCRCRDCAADEVHPDEDDYR